MKSQLAFDQSVFRILYLKYREFVVPACIIAVCIGIFFFVTTAQFQGWQKDQAEEKVLKDKISVLSDNISLLQSQNDATLASDVDTSISSLPLDKDFAGILTAIANAAVLSGASLGDFSFSVGELSSSSSATPNSDIPNIQIEIALEGEAEEIEGFVQEVSRSTPLSSVSVIENDNGRSSVLTLFYYKPYNIFASSETTPLKPLTQAQRETLGLITEWNSSQPPLPPQFLNAISSLSADLNSSPSGF